MNVLITGDRGYVGSALRRRFEGDSRFKVEGADVRSPGQGQDITKWDCVGASVYGPAPSEGPDLIFNLAGLSGEGQCRADEGRAFDVNAEAPFKLRKLWPKAIFVQASSASVLELVKRKEWG